MSFFPLRYKKTTPFSPECSWFEDVGEGLMDSCIQPSTTGFYYDRGEVIRIVSLCDYHAIVQESLFKAGQE
jgi:hypothetical protein